MTTEFLSPEIEEVETLTNEDICELCYGTGEMVMNAGMEDEYTEPCPDCKGLKEEDCDSYYENERDNNLDNPNKC